MPAVVSTSTAVRPTVVSSGRRRPTDIVPIIRNPIATTIEMRSIIIIIQSGIGPLVGTPPSIGGDDDDKDDNSIILRLTMLTVCLSESMISIKSALSKLALIPIIAGVAWVSFRFTVVQDGG